MHLQRQSHPHARHPHAPALPHLGPLTVAAPLRLAHTPAGRVLSMQPPLDCAVVVRIAAARSDPGMYDAHLVLADDSDGPACAVINAVEKDTDSHALVAGQVLIGVRHSSDGDDEEHILVVWPTGLFPVDLMQDGGADADASTNMPASWTYTLGRDGTTLVTEVPVEKARPLAVMTTPGTRGMAYYDDSSGTLKLWEADEVFAIYACETAGE